MMRCLDLYIWKPERRNAKNRAKTNVVLGITNRDCCYRIDSNTYRYWLIGEVDHKNIDVEELKQYCYMIIETRKGYHFYLRYWSCNPLHLVHRAMKCFKWLDRGQLKMALKRYRLSGKKESAFLVLRVSPKYSTPDLKPIYVSPDLPEWHRQVLDLIESLNKVIV